MNKTLLYEGPAVRSEMIVLMLDKWGLHAELQELADRPDPDDLDRDTQVFIAAAEYDRAREILYGESETERAGF